MSEQGNTLADKRPELIDAVGALLKREYPGMHISEACDALLIMAGSMMAFQTNYQVDEAWSRKVQQHLAHAYELTCAKHHTDAAIAAASGNIH